MRGGGHVLVPVSTAATLLSLTLMLAMPRCLSGALSMQHGPVGKPVGTPPSYTLGLLAHLMERFCRRLSIRLVRETPCWQRGLRSS